mmetsp:Transcript_58569/g.156784  ORF Transcript_58569/g.156784 Transcript_58569/m.156784 type:complete len:204 (+) Transcript_58569:405-1016(+)
MLWCAPCQRSPPSPRAPCEAWNYQIPLRRQSACPPRRQLLLSTRRRRGRGRRRCHPQQQPILANQRSWPCPSRGPRTAGSRAASPHPRCAPQPPCPGRSASPCLRPRPSRRALATQSCCRRQCPRRGACRQPTWAERRRRKQRASPSPQQECQSSRPASRGCSPCSSSLRSRQPAVASSPRQMEDQGSTARVGTPTPSAAHWA